jgi:hypothetical protein
MKIRYHRYQLFTLINNSIKEGIDALVDKNCELYNYVRQSDKFGFLPKFDNEVAPDIEGYTYIGLIYARISPTNPDPSPWVRLYVDLSPIP